MPESRMTSAEGGDVRWCHDRAGVSPGIFSPKGKREDLLPHQTSLRHQVENWSHLCLKWSLPTTQYVLYNGRIKSVEQELFYFVYTNFFRYVNDKEERKTNQRVQKKKRSRDALHFAAICAKTCVSSSLLTLSITLGLELSLHYTWQRHASVFADILTAFKEILSLGEGRDMSAGGRQHRIQ